jgi:hypothetical protein
MISGVLQNGDQNFDKSGVILSFYDSHYKQSSIYQARFEPGQNDLLVQIVQVGNGPLKLPVGQLVTIAYEFLPQKLILGLDEPLYYLFDGSHLHKIEDPCVHNKICSQIQPI